MSSEVIDMTATITVDSFLPWILQESRKAAQTTLTGAYLTDELWALTLDALAWLRKVSADERAEVLARVRQWLTTGQIGEMTMPEDQREAECLTTVLRWVLNPPPVL
jgi:hypothetical protein